MVLGLLRNGDTLHGYALMKEYRERSGLQISTGNFYRELQRLTAEGLVRAATNPVGADPRRAPYEITEEGSAAFDAWLCGRNLTVLGQCDDELSTRALFIAGAEPPVTRKILDEWREELWIRSKMLERAREAVLPWPGSTRQRRFAPLTLLLARRLSHIAADLEFVEKLRSAYEEWLTPPRVDAPARARGASPARTPSRRPRRTSDKA